MTQAKTLTKLGDGYTLQGADRDIWVVRPDGTPAGVGHRIGAEAVRLVNPIILGNCVRQCKISDYAARS